MNIVFFFQIYIWLEGMTMCSSSLTPSYNNLVTYRNKTQRRITQTHSVYVYPFTQRRITQAHSVSSTVCTRYWAFVDTALCRVRVSTRRSNHLVTYIFTSLFKHLIFSLKNCLTLRLEIANLTKAVYSVHLFCYEFKYFNQYWTKMTQFHPLYNISPRQFMVNLKSQLFSN